MQDSGTAACAARYRRCSLISAGPVAQLSPITSMPSGSSAVSAAPISEPSSIVPVVSMVTWAISMMSAPAWAAQAVIARRAPTIAALAWSRSWQVSTISASAPPRSRPAALAW